MDKNIFIRPGRRTPRKTFEELERLKSWEPLNFTENGFPIRRSEEDFMDEAFAEGVQAGTRLRGRAHGARPAQETPTQKGMEMTAMYDAILSLVTRTRTVSFAEMSSQIPGFNGDLALMLESDDYGNICMWPSLSKEAVDALEALRVARAIHPVPTPWLTYVIDGVVPNLPIAKSRRKYKKSRRRMRNDNNNGCHFR
jgi:hypothetical protein